MMRSAFVAGVLLVLAVVWSPVAVLADDDVLIRGIPLSTLIEHLQGEDPVLGRAALAVLGAAAGPEAAAAVPALLDLLDADEAVDRGMAIGALGRIGPAANSAAGRLEEIAERDPDPVVRARAQMALIRTGPPGAPAAERPRTEGGLPEGDWTLETVPEPIIPAADPGVTAYLQPLRDHRAKLSAIDLRIGALQATQPEDNAQARQWAQDLQAAGNDLVAEGRAFKATLNAFVNSRTRRGLTEELDLIRECFELTDRSGSAIGARINFDLQAYAAARNLQQEATAARNELVALLAQKVDERVEAEGLIVLLATEGIVAVRNEAVSRLRAGAEQELDQITQREIGLAFHDASSFRSAVRAKAHDLVQRKVAQLLFKITSNEIIVELLGAPIVAWIEGELWPRLKEAFRNKGDLEFRTQRSANSLEAARMRLWALPPDATLDQVRAAMRNGQAALNATRYLVGDLNRANRADLYARLEESAEQLKRAFTITQQRFLLHKLEALEKVAPQEDVYRALLALIEAMVREIEIPEATTQIAGTDEGGAAAEGTPNQPVERFEFGPLYLVHIILTHTMYGPQEKDTWILHPNTPDAEGTLLTADGSGGYFINKSDKHQGPFTSNYQLAPVLVQLGIPGIWIGQKYINADPAIWGNR